MLRDSLSVVDVDSFDPHSDTYSGGFGLPLSVQDEINAFSDEMDMLRAQEDLAADEARAEAAEPKYRTSLSLLGKRIAAYVTTPDGRKVKAGTFGSQNEAWGAADAMIAALKARKGA